MAPLSLLVWLSFRVVQDEQKMIQVKFDELLLGKLSDISVTISKLMEDRERKLAKITDINQYDVNSLRPLVRDRRIVRQIFVLDSKGERIHPPTSGQLTRSEQSFITKTRRMLQDRTQFFRPMDEIQDSKKSSSSRSGSWHEKHKQMGWHVWFWDEGINFIFWQRSSSGHIVGVEVDRMALLSDIVGELPETDMERPGLEDGRIRLVDASERPVYGWGAYEPSDREKPRVSIKLGRPLSSWKLEYLAPATKLTDVFRGSMLVNLAYALGTLGLMLLGLSFYFLRESNREIRTAGKRVTFVNQVSHELKTPLTNIRMYAELLEENMDEEDEKLKNYLNVITSESQRLSRLINNVLTFGRQQQKRQIIRPVPHVPDRIIENVIDQFRPSLDEKGVEITFNGGAEDSVIIDADALGQILANLLSNVEKYASSGKLAAVTSGIKGDKTIIMVDDMGPGIPKSARNKIFKPFERLSSLIEDGASGTGIGLTISRELSRLHGGDLTYEPCKKGSCFKVTLKTPLKKN